MIILDRFEGAIAVLETDDGIINIEKNLVSIEAREGDILEFDNDRYIVDSEATEIRRKEIREKFNRLRRKIDD